LHIYLDARDHYIRLRLLSNETVVEEKEFSIVAPFYELNLIPGRSYQLEVEMINKIKGDVIEKDSKSFRSGWPKKIVPKKFF
jgi:hypothetical protein